MHLDRGEVYLNPDLDRWEQRKRFVTGHEVAHAVLDDHRLAIAHLDDKSRLNPDFADRLERQANQFSIELLAKGDQLRADFDSSPPSMGSLEMLAKRYGISLQAAARRLAEESEHPCAVALAYRSERGAGSVYLGGYKLWCSKSFNARLAWRQGRTPVTNIHSVLSVITAGARPAPLMCVDVDARGTLVAVEGMDAHFAVIALFSCEPLPRLNLRRANPLSRISFA